MRSSRHARITGIYILGMFWDLVSPPASKKDKQVSLDEIERPSESSFSLRPALPLFRDRDTHLSETK